MYSGTPSPFRSMKISNSFTLGADQRRYVLTAKRRAVAPDLRTPTARTSFEAKPSSGSAMPQVKMSAAPAIAPPVFETVALFDAVVFASGGETVVSRFESARGTR